MVSEEGNKLALHRVEIRMMDVLRELKDKLSCTELRQRLGIQDIVKAVASKSG